MSDTGDHTQHQAVEGGFECVCGATRQTPLGIDRHRSNCTEYQENTA